jgi:hypothetical protein
VITCVATWVYLLFAFVVLPIYLPLGIRALEPAGTRRRVMSGFVALGAVVSSALLVAMIREPVIAREAVFSGYRQIAVFGIVNLVGVAVLAKFTSDGFASLWCGWAALTSLAIALHLRYGAPHQSVEHALAEVVPHSVELRWRSS